MKKTNQNKKLILEQLSKNPVLELACQKINISRMTFHRWKQTDKDFAKKVDEAISEGCLLVNDLAESQLISSVKDKNIAGIQYWLRHHHPAYNNKIQITAEIKNTNELTPEQNALLAKASILAALPEPTEHKKENETH